MTQRINNLKTYLSPSMWYSLSYPKDWEFEEDETCTSFYKNDGVGALQISAYDTDNHQSAEDSLIEYVKDEGVTNEVNISNYKIQQKEFASCSYTQGEDFFKVWIITKGKILVLATYNREINLKNAEDDEVDNIVTTLDILV